MRKVLLGNTGTSVSAICLGTPYIGTKEDNQYTSNRMEYHGSRKPFFGIREGLRAPWGA